MESVDLDSLIGKSLDNRFELKKLIGQGGYGAVFDAVQTSMQRRCAVKVLSIQTDDPKEIARFELEARVTCQLTHPNTIVVYEYGHDEELGVFFIAMEFLDGQSLTDLSNSRTLSTEEVLYILGQIADSLDDAHTYDLVHRDIKPHNVMIVKRGTDELSVKVIDFGIAKTTEKGLNLTQTDTIIGTPEYMSTEQVLNKTLTGKSDQYALAVTAYYLLTGRTLFNCDTALQVAVAHASEIPPAISTVTDRFIGAEHFDLTLLKALSKEPESRFESCREFVDALVENKPGDNPDSSEYALFSGSESPALSTKSFEHAVAKTEAAPVEPAVQASVEPVKHGVTSGSLEVFKAPEKNNKMVFLVLGLVAVVALLIGFIVMGPDSNSKLADNSDTTTTILKKGDISPIVEKSKPQIIEEKTVVEPIPIVAEKAPAIIVEKTPAIKKNEILKPKSVSKKVSETLGAVKAKTKIAAKPVKTVEKPKKDLKGTVKVYTSPWGDIYIDGKKRSSKTRYTIKLSEGMHTFSLKQQGVAKTTKRLEVKAGESHRVRLNAD